MGRKAIEKRWTDEQFIEAVKSSISMSEALRKLGLVPQGSFRVGKNKIKELGLDISHWLGRRHLLGKKRGNIKNTPLSDVLKENSNFSTCCLKKRLISDGILKNECSICKQQPIWMNKPLIMILDHINGVYNDNRLENLRLVCRHCDSQLPTFCGRNNIGHKKQEKSHCIDCEKEVNRGTLRCCKCEHIRIRKVERPSCEQLLKDTSEMPITKIGEKYGVTDNAIRKWLYGYGTIPQKKMFEKQLNNLKKYRESTSQKSKELHTCKCGKPKKKLRAKMCRECYLKERKNQNKASQI
jgi:hypothetical protein